MPTLTGGSYMRLVMMLDGSASLSRADEFEHPQIAQHIHVVADGRDGCAQLLSNLLGAGWAFHEDGQGASPDRIGQRTDQPLVVGHVASHRPTLTGPLGGMGSLRF